MWSLLPGGLLIEGHLSGNSILVSVVFFDRWSPYPSGRLDRFYSRDIKKMENVHAIIIEHLEVVLLAGVASGVATTECMCWSWD